MAEARRVLESRTDPDAVSIDVLGNHHSVERRVFVTDDMTGFYWDHLRTVVRVETRSTKHGVVTTDNRYYVCSLASTALSAQQWLLLVRRRWAVENEAHHTLDVAFREDDRPWIVADPVGALNVLILRRIALSVLTLFRSRHLRSDESRAMAWRHLMNTVRLVLLQLTEAEATPTRRRSRSPPNPLADPLHAAHAL